MTAAYNNTAKIDGTKEIRYVLNKTEHKIMTRYIEKLQYNQILGSDFLEKFQFTIDFAQSTCCLPGGGRGRQTSPIRPI